MGGTHWLHSMLCGLDSETLCPRLQAATQPKGSMERLLTVAAFAQSGFAAGLRAYKCINPIMGETYEVCGVSILSLYHQLATPHANHTVFTGKAI